LLLFYYPPKVVLVCISRLPYIRYPSVLSPLDTSLALHHEIELTSPWERLQVIVALKSIDMIDKALSFIASEVNKYIDSKKGIDTKTRLILGNPVRIAEPTLAINTGDAMDEYKLLLSLVNIEEDKVSKQPENFKRIDDRVVYKNPKILLNLYLLFVANSSTYVETLEYLSLVIQCFQYQKVFEPATHPGLDPKIRKLIIEMFTLNFEQVNHLWSTLGGKYIPSMLYKLKVVAIEDDAIDAEGDFIKQIQVVEGHNPMN